MTTIKRILIPLTVIGYIASSQVNALTAQLSVKSLKNNFQNPPNSARPGVYWHFMHCNLSKESISKDLEAMKGLKPFLRSFTNFFEPINEAVIAKNRIINVTRFLRPDGTLDWKVPEGKWTIMRFGSRNNSAVADVPMCEFWSK